MHEKRVPFGGKGRLGKLCNEDDKAFDILCHRLQAVSIQCRSRISEWAREGKPWGREQGREGGKTTGEKRRRIRRGKRSVLSPYAPSGRRWATLSVSGGEGEIKSSAAPPNYGQLQIMAGRKCHNNHVLIGATPVAQRCLSLAGSLSWRAIVAGLWTSTCLCVSVRSQKHTKPRTAWD